MRCNLDKNHSCKVHGSCCTNSKIGQSWCKKTNKNMCKFIRKKMQCRLIKGIKETCCINPTKGHWCWSNKLIGNNGSSRKLVKTMKKQCCKK